MLTFNKMASSKIKRRRGKSLPLAKIDILFVLLITKLFKKPNEKQHQILSCFEKDSFWVCGGEGDTNESIVNWAPTTYLGIRTHNLWGPEGLPLLLPLAFETLKSPNPNSVYRVGFCFALVFSLFCCCVSCAFLVWRDSLRVSCLCFIIVPDWFLLRSFSSRVVWRFTLQNLGCFWKWLLRLWLGIWWWGWGWGGRDRGETEERFRGFSVICGGGGGKGEAQEKKRCRRQKAQLSHGFLTKP